MKIALMNAQIIILLYTITFTILRSDVSFSTSEPRLLWARMLLTTV